MKKWFRTDNAMKILAIVMALGLWLFVLYSQKPMSKEVLRGIPVTYTGTYALEGAGLVVQQADSQLLDIEVRGVRTAVAKADKTNVFANASVANITDPGTYEIPVDVKITMDSVQLGAKNNYTTKVTVEKLVKKSFPIRVMSTNMPQGENTFVRITPVPAEVTLSGPGSMINLINSVDVDLDLSDLQDKNVYTRTYKIVNNKEEDIFLDKNISKSVENININCEMFNAKKLPVEAVTEGRLQSGYAIESIRVEPNIIELAGSEQMLNAIEMLSTTPVNINGINKTISVNIPINFPETTFDTAEQTNVKVTIEVAKRVVKNHEIYSVKIENESPNSLKFVVNNLPIKVRAYGTEKNLGNLVLNSTVDVTGLEPGNYDLPLKIVSPRYVDVPNSYSVNVTVTEGVSVGNVTLGTP